MSFSLNYEKEFRDSNLVGVYGSLRRGSGNHRLLRGATYWGTGLTVESFSMLGNHPSIPVVFRPSMQKADKRTVGPVEVEVYRMTGEDQFRSLDRLEGHPNCYRREMIGVTLGNCQVLAWVYLYREPVELWGRTVMINETGTLTWFNQTIEENGEG